MRRLTCTFLFGFATLAAGAAPVWSDELCGWLGMVVPFFVLLVLIQCVTFLLVLW